MIANPSRIDHRIFKAFVWPVGLPAFGRYNLLYGWNGCGKTTLSNLLRRMERKEALLAADGSAEFLVGPAILAAADFPTAIGLPAIRVFNRDFVDASVFSSTAAISPIFYFGADSVEKQKRIEELRREHQTKTEEGVRLKQARDDADNALDRHCIDQATRVRELLSSPGKNAYNNYDKRSFRAASETNKTVDFAAKRLTQEAKTALRLKTTNQLQDALPPLAVVLPECKQRAEDVSALLGRSVVSKVLAELEDNDPVARWVQSGVALHQGPVPSPTCLFCAQDLPVDRLAKLEGHFNDEFQRFMDELVAMQRTLVAEADEIEAWKIPAKSEFFSHLRERATAPLAELAWYQQEAPAYLRQLVAALEVKRTKPFAALGFAEHVIGEPPDTTAAGTASAALATLIREHNEECGNFATGIDRARRQLEEAVVVDALPDYIAKFDFHVTSASTYNQAVIALGTLATTIGDLEKEISESIKPTVELTQELASYLGQSDLKFEPKEKGYAITRNGVPATHLSEGEKTAIAFLYFLKSLQDKSFNLAASVVVIDDPISSLDANAMFCAFGFMKARTKDAGQLIILTHNFGFFRQVKNWFYHLPGQKKKDAAQRPARFYLQQCNTVGGVRSATIGPLDPLLHQYESEYHYLFYRIQSELGKAAAANLADYYALPNMARRLLESFLAFRYPVEESLVDKLDRVAFSDAKKARILRFLHTYSHDGKISDPEHDLSVLAETPQILADLMDLVKAEDSRHFDEMTKVLAEAATQR